MMDAESYLAAMSVKRSDRETRHAFRESALRILPARGCVFDFGAGPGIDAKFYAAAGHRVLAYDNDPQMRKAFTHYCAAEIGRGQVTLYGDSYPQFLRRLSEAPPDAAKVDLITSNFAPLNLIGELPELFRALQSLTAPGAHLLASVLNPWYLGDLRYPWWWANRWSYWKRRRFCVAGTGTQIWRRSVTDFAAAAAPGFRLRVVGGGKAPTDAAAPVVRGSWALSTSRYLFLIFERL